MYSTYLKQMIDQVPVIINAPKTDAELEFWAMLEITVNEKNRFFKINYVNNAIETIIFYDNAKIALTKMYLDCLLIEELLKNETCITGDEKMVNLLMDNKVATANYIVYRGGLMMQVTLTDHDFLKYMYENLVIV